MRDCIKLLYRFVLLTIGFVVIGCDASLFGCDDAVISEVVSPDGRYVATVLERDCGATTDYSTMVALRDAAQPIEEAKQTPVLVIESRVMIDLQWGADRKLLIVFPPSETFAKLEAWRDVQIIYP